MPWYITNINTLLGPATSADIPADYLERVREMHEKGGFDSIGWRYDWSEEETRKNLLRTHTTAVSSRTLYKIAQLAKVEVCKLLLLHAHLSQVRYMQFC